MQRRQFLRNTGLAAGLASIAPKNLLAGFWQQASYQLTPLRGDVGIFTEKGGTIGYYAGPDGWLVIDSEFPEPAQHLIAELKKMKDSPFRYLINTHHHGDHTGGNIAFKGLVDHVVGHENCLANYKRVAAQSHSEDKQLFQDQTFGNSGWKLAFGKEKLKTYYFGPGNTNGDAIIHFEHANIAHMGDLMFNQLAPYIDRSAGANIKNWIQALEKTEKLFDKDTLFIFGHAVDNSKVTGSKTEIAAFKDYLNKLLDFTAQQIKAGKTKAEIVKITEIPGISWKDSGAERSFSAAYDELTAN